MARAFWLPGADGFTGSHLTEILVGLGVLLTENAIENGFFTQGSRKK